MEEITERVSILAGIICYLFWKEASQDLNKNKMFNHLLGRRPFGRRKMKRKKLRRDK